MKLPLALALLSLPGLAADAPAPGKNPETTAPDTAGKPAAADAAELRQLLQRGLFEEEASRELGKAAAAYSTLLSQYESHRALAATALFRLAEIRVKQKDEPAAVALYQRLIAEFPGQENLVALSRERLAKLAPAPATPGTSNAPADSPTAEEAAELIRLREMAKNSPDLLQAKTAFDGTSRTPLENAAAKGWVRAVTFLLDQKIDANGAAGNGEPLVAASGAGHKGVVELLLVRGAATMPPAGVEVESSALGRACERDRNEVVKLLLARGADPNFVDRQGRTPIQQALVFGARQEILERLVEKGAKLNVAGRAPENPDNDFPAAPPLTLAIHHQNGSTALVKFLLDHGADANFDGGSPNYAPLAWAIFYGNEALAALLLEHGAKPELTVDFPNDREGPDRLLKFATTQNPKLAHLLLQHGASKSLAGTGGMTPLHWAVSYWQPKSTTAAPAMPKETPVLTRLGLPAAPGGQQRLGADDVATIKGLCEALLTGPNAADINAGPQGYTPLHAAMARRNLPDDFIAWLISKGADPVRRTSAGQSPWDYLDLERAVLLECDYFFPKIQRKDAVTVLSRMPSFRSGAPDYFPQSADAKEPPTIPQLIQQTFAPEQAAKPAPSSTQSAREFFAASKYHQVRQQFNVLVMRPGPDGRFNSAGVAPVNVPAGPPKGEWPAVQWGDIVVFYSTDSDSAKGTMTAAAIANWAKPDSEKTVPATQRPADPESAPRPPADRLRPPVRNQR